MAFLVGGNKVDEPFKYTLGNIEIQGPSSNPSVRPSVVEYTAMPEIYHQFRPDQKLINTLVSGLFTVLVLGQPLLSNSAGS